MLMHRRIGEIEQRANPTQGVPVLQAFDAVVEASGSSHGIKLASAMTRPMGSIVLKSTCSAVSDASMPAWSDIANDVVVNEKRLQGSRCGRPILHPSLCGIHVKLR